MAVLPAGALPGTGPQPTGTDAQGGGLQSQTAGGHPGSANDIESLHLERAMEPMKNKNHDELDGDKSIFASPRCCGDHSISKAIPFADISFRNLCKRD